MKHLGLTKQVTRKSGMLHGDRRQTGDLLD